MKSRYELPFSTGYVPGWTYIEAFRELFQNALDNETVNPANRMLFFYDPENKTLRVCNKTSVLELDSLLLGSTTKADDARTIGQHGEGYKIAFLVLLREGRPVTVYNYGKREVWHTKLVKSKRYNGQMVPVITVDKEAVWKRIPDNDLTIEVGNVAPEEYQEIVKKNLNLQSGVQSYEVPTYGRILLDEQERGNVYVKGLFVCNNESMRYGYDLDPRLINLDRDRRLVSSFELCWETSLMWKRAFADRYMRADVMKMIIDNANDVKFIQSRTLPEAQTDQEIADAIAVRFIRSYGADAVPVVDNAQLRAAGQSAVLVNQMTADYLSQANKVQVRTPAEEKSVADELASFKDSISSRLSFDELTKFSELIARVSKLETQVETSF